MVKPWVFWLMILTATLLSAAAALLAFITVVGGFWVGGSFFGLEYGSLGVVVGAIVPMVLAAASSAEAWRATRLSRQVRAPLRSGILLTIGLSLSAALLGGVVYAGWLAPGLVLSAVVWVVLPSDRRAET